MKVLLVLALVVFISLVLGDGDGGVFRRKQVNENNGNMRRKFVFNAGPHTVDFIGERYDKNTKTGTRVRFTFSTAIFPVFRIRRLSKDSSNDISGFQFRAGLLDVVEYQESSNGTEGLDDSDKIWRKLPLNGQGIRQNGRVFDDKITFSNSTDVNGTSVYQCTALGDSKNGDTIEIDLYVSTVQKEINWRNKTKIVTRPDGFEYGITISNWDFEGRTNTRLAIRTVIESDRAQRTHGGPQADVPDSTTTDGDGIVVGDSTDATNQGFFVWDNTVTVTDQSGVQSEVPIVRSVLKTTLKDMSWTNNDFKSGEIDTTLTIDRKFVSFSVLQDHPASILWDPYVGLSGDSNGVASLSFLGAVLVFFAKYLF